MNRNSLLALAFATVFGAVSGAAALPQTAFAKDDPVKRKEDREKYRKKQEDANVLCYFDLTYGVDRGPKDKPKIDSRWSRNAHASDAKEDEGIQFSLNFADSRFPEGSGISFRVQKFLHKKGNSEFNVPFEHAGKSPKTADKNGMIEGFYAEYANQFKDLVKDKCVQPKKVKIGPADLFASVVGTAPGSGKRERMDFYIWQGPNTTWACVVVFTGTLQEKAADFEEKVTEVLKAHKELKAPD